MAVGGISIFEFDIFDAKIAQISISERNRNIFRVLVFCDSTPTGDSTV